mmetsp:Transcript_23085/g.28350  ORF Transcript_23085/g.28350 Transcript_23085/m.28350 type:complete len:94 (+) Transcript_23085:221-502(+)
MGIETTKIKEKDQATLTIIINIIPITINSIVLLVVIAIVTTIMTAIVTIAGAIGKGIFSRETLEGSAITGEQDPMSNGDNLVQVTLVININRI